MPIYDNNIIIITPFDLYDTELFRLEQGIPTNLIDNCGNVIKNNSVDKKKYNSNFGKYKKPNIFLKLSLVQDIVDLGVYKNYFYIPKTTILDELISLKYRKIGVLKDKYYTVNVSLNKGTTNDKLDEIRGFGGDYAIKKDYVNSTYNGLLEKKINSVIYIENGLLENGLYKPNTGVIYETQDETLETSFSFINQGDNINSIDLQESVFDEILLGTVEFDDKTELLKINRGNYNIFAQHLKLENYKI